MLVRFSRETITYEQLAKTIDHSLLRPELTEAEVIEGIEMGKHYHVASVCVKPYHVRLAARCLQGSDVRVGTVVGFPHGSQTVETKVFEACQAVGDGADELDMVLNIGELRSGHAGYIEREIRSVVQVSGGKAVVKVILENAYLSDDEKVLACRLSEASGANFVKTSTGFAPGGANLPDLKLMRSSVGPLVQVKAAGGVRTLDALFDVIEAGVTRVGATATAAILDEFIRRRDQEAAGDR